MVSVYANNTFKLSNTGLLSDDSEGSYLVIHSTRDTGTVQYKYRMQLTRSRLSGDENLCLQTDRCYLQHSLVFHISVERPVGISIAPQFTQKSCSGIPGGGCHGRGRPVGMKVQTYVGPFPSAISQDSIQAED